MVSHLAELPALSRDDVQRYSRHLVLEEIGTEGQRRLKAARVLCVGAGGLGSPAALYLAAAGIGTIGLVDFDTVDLSNLQRQILYGTGDVGRPKLEAAARRLAGLNPSLELRTHETRLSSANALALVGAYDVVVDGTDNFAARYLVNDACVLLGRPNVYGSVFRFEGQAAVFAAAGGPCYRCLHPEPPPPGLVPSCEQAGVLGVVPGIIGTIQATEAIKLVTGSGEPLIGRLLVYDALRMRFRELTLPKDPGCPICGTCPTIEELRDEAPLCGALADVEGPSLPEHPEVTATELEALLVRGEVALLDVREASEHRICRIPGSTLIPLGELSRRVDELDPSRPLVVHCRSGVRSARAAAWLRARGFADVRNLKGGILAWIADVDPGLAKY